MGKVLFTWSSGKDSARALWELRKSDEYEIVSLLTTLTSDYGRISMHGVREELLDAQAASLGIPLEKVKIRRDASNEDYEQAFETALQKYKENGVETVAFGDLYLEDLKKYREENLSKIGMKALFPIWNMNTEKLARDNIDSGFRTVVTCVDTKQLDGSFAGREIDASFLADLPDSVDPCGENGEFHSFCFDGPCFEAPVEFSVGKSVLRNGQFKFTDLLPAQQSA